MSEEQIARLDERFNYMRRDLDKVPDMIAQSRDALAERIRYEIEQAFKLADGQRENAQHALEERLKSHVTAQFETFEKHLDEKFKSDWKRQIPTFIALGMVGIMFGIDKLWPFIRTFWLKM